MLQPSLQDPNNSQTLGEEVLSAPLLTLVVPIFRFKLFSQRALRGLASQDSLLRNNVQLLFVADGVGVSPAQRAHIQRECTGYNSINYIELPYNTHSAIVSDPGAIPIAVGFAVAKGTFVACLGEDNVHKSNYLSTIIPILRDSTADLLYCFRSMYGSESQKFIIDDTFESTGVDTFIDANCMIFHKRALVNTLGLWRFESNYSADRFLFAAIAHLIKTGLMTCQEVAHFLIDYYARPAYEKELLQISTNRA